MATTGLSLHNTYLSYTAWGTDYYFACVILPKRYTGFCMGVQHPYLIYSAAWTGAYKSLLLKLCDDTWEWTISNSSNYMGSSWHKSFLTWRASIHGEDLSTSCCESFYAYAWKSLVLCYTHGNKLRQIPLFTGAPHSVNPSLIISLDACLYMGRI